MFERCPDMRLYRFALLGFLLCATLGCRSTKIAPPVVERPEFARYYEEAGVEGTFVLYDLQHNIYLIHNPTRVDTRQIPASTYKILNSLIALETGAVADENEVIPWDGVERAIEPWNRDHTMRSAIQVSAVPFYQEVARRIGQKRMNKWVKRVSYGNEDTGGGLDQFWLSGNLRISPREQVDFLARLHRGDLPFSQRSIDIVKDILVQERTDTYVLRGKTGWSDSFQPEVGWYVGYVVREGNAYFFANNIDIRKNEDAAHRAGIARRILADLGLIDVTPPNK